jgi:hypothetical protein
MGECLVIGVAHHESGGSFLNAMLAAIRRASSLLSNFAADLRPGSSLIEIRERLFVVIAH